jgi:hypothetical protein
VSLFVLGGVGSRSSEVDKSLNVCQGTCRLTFRRCLRQYHNILSLLCTHLSHYIWFYYAGMILDPDIILFLCFWSAIVLSAASNFNKAVSTHLPVVVEAMIRHD